jgi:hypothetical protein
VLLNNLELNHFFKQYLIKLFKWYISIVLSIFEIFEMHLLPIVKEASWYQFNMFYKNENSYVGDEKPN